MENRDGVFVGRGGALGTPRVKKFVHR